MIKEFRTKADIDKIVEQIGGSLVSTERTEEEKMDEVNAILRMDARNLGCKVSDLQWKRDRFGAIHVRKRKDAIT